MSGSVDKRDSERPGSIAVLCREFQVQQDSGQTPAIEEYLSRLGADERPSLLVELVVLDLDARRRAGEHPTLDEYLRRFPQYADLLRERLSPGFDSADPSMGSTVSLSSGGSPGSILSFQHVELRPKSTLGRYELIERLGRGAFGEVWKARDPGLSRLVAIKTLRSDCTFPEAAVRSFLVEGQRLAQLRHTGIVCVYDVGVEEGRVYIVSELVDGETLATRLDREPGALSPAESAEFVAQVADAVHHAHLQGIVHRDIKPSNILLDRSGRPLLADFGLAITEEDQLSEPAAAVGTLAYMSPEQFRGESHRADGRADVYSLGVILYRMLTGRLPFKANSREQWRDQILHRAPRPPRMINDSIPAALEAVCLKCLSKGVEERYTTAADLAEGLRGAVRESATPVFRTRRVALSLTGLVAAVLLGVALVAALRRDDDNGGGVLPLPANSVVARPLVFPTHDGVSTWTVIEDGRKLVVSANSYGMLQIGELSRADSEWTVEIGMVDWTDPNLGVFWGYRFADDGSDRLQFDSIELGQEAQAGGRYYLRRVRTSFKDPVRREPLGLSRAYLEEFADRPSTLTLKFAEDRLAKVTWNGQDLPELVSDLEGSEFEDDSAAGGIGVLVNGESVSFSKVRLDGLPLHFRQPAAHEQQP